MYAVLQDKVVIEGKETKILDVMNPAGMFRDGLRVQQWTTKNLLPMSGKLIPEFDRRRNIRDMFSRKPSLLTSHSSVELLSNGNTIDKTLLPMPNLSRATVKQSEQAEPALSTLVISPANSPPKANAPLKRSQKETAMPAAKRFKSTSQSSNTSDASRGQKSLKGFFAPKTISKAASQSDGLDGVDDTMSTHFASEKDAIQDVAATAAATAADDKITVSDMSTSSPARSQHSNGDTCIDPIVSKESWGKLFVKPAAPKCEHDEPCKTMLTKKSGINCGRSFWMCARPLGPSGNKERGTQWRCSTFIWASDWNGGG